MTKRKKIDSGAKTGVETGNISKGLHTQTRNLKTMIIFIQYILIIVSPDPTLHPPKSTPFLSFSH